MNDLFLLEHRDFSDSMVRISTLGTKTSSEFSLVTELHSVLSQCMHTFVVLSSKARGVGTWKVMG